MLLTTAGILELAFPALVEWARSSPDKSSPRVTYLTEVGQMTVAVHRSWRGEQMEFPPVLGGFPRKMGRPLSDDELLDLSALPQCSVG